MLVSFRVTVSMKTELGPAHALPKLLFRGRKHSIIMQELSGEQAVQGQVQAGAGAGAGPGRSRFMRHSQLVRRCRNQACTCCIP